MMLNLIHVVFVVNELYLAYVVGHVWWLIVTTYSDDWLNGSIK